MIETSAEIFKHKYLVNALALRHLSTRYRGSLLGFFWSFLNPLCLMLVYTLVFKYYIRFSGVDNYSVFIFCGLLPWLWTTQALSEGTSSIVSGGHLVTKSMFPAHVLGTVSVITALFNFLFSLPILLVVMLVSGYQLHVTWLGLLLLIPLNFIFLLGLVWALSPLNVKFRDVQHVVGNFLTFVFFLCPIVYPVSTVPESFRFTLHLNPFALFTIAYQNLLYDGVLPSAQTILYLGAFSLLCLLIGSMIYRETRETLAEML